MSKLGDLGHRLYTGEVSYDFVGKRKRWYTISAVVLVLAAIGLFGRGLNLGIEFKGGAEFNVRNTTATVEQARAAVEAAGVADPIVQTVGANGLRIQTPALTTEQSRQVQQSLATTLGVDAQSISVQVVGPSWGAQITTKALQGLAIFLALLAIFLSIYFEWKMALAAILGMVHDIFITVGIYALTGIEVTPATVIGVLTILGFSLYDNVVVFDKVKENTRGITSSNRSTYSEAANLALNQTLVRSINTSVVALLPVLSILIVGVFILGAGTLTDLSLALFIGTATGTYSSLLIATPLLCQFKEREPAMQALAKRVEARRSGLDAKGVKSGRSGKSAKGGATATLVADEAPEELDEPLPDTPVAPAPPRPAKSGPRPQPKRPAGKRKRKR